MLPSICLAYEFKRWPVLTHSFFNLGSLVELWQRRLTLNTNTTVTVRTAAVTTDSVCCVLNGFCKIHKMEHIFLFSDLCQFFGKEQFFCALSLLPLYCIPTWYRIKKTYSGLRPNTVCAEKQVKVR